MRSWHFCSYMIIYSNELNSHNLMNLYSQIHSKGEMRFLLCVFTSYLMKFSHVQSLKTMPSQLSHCWHLLVSVSDCRPAWGPLEIRVAPFWPCSQLLVAIRKSTCDQETLKVTQRVFWPNWYPPFPQHPGEHSFS